MQVTIGGEPRTLGDFNAYKAFKAMEMITSVEGLWREGLNEAARWKREYESEHFVELDRATARRHFRPQPLIEIVQEERDDDKVAVVERPILKDGEPVLGADPLGHLTEEDWKQSGQKLVLPESPSQNLQTAFMVPLAFRLGRDQVLRLLALAITPNAELERWDDESAALVDEELDRAGKALLHRAGADELPKLAVAVLRHFKDQVAGPFEELVEEVQATFTKREPEQPPTQAPPPMTLETEPSTDGSPTSASESADDSDGATGTSSTAPASESSLGSASG